MSNALFYTFSTIAQTLAGAMALLAAFLLYRLQTLNGTIERDAERISLAIEGLHGRARQFFDDGQYKELLAAAAQVAFPPGHYRAETERTRLPRLLGKKTRLVRDFQVALYLTAGLITFSVLALILTPYAANRAWCVTVMFVIGIVGFALCMASYIRVLKSAFA